MKNVRIRKAMSDAGLNQRTLSQLLGKTECEMSVILNHYELAAREQTRIIGEIRASTRKGAQA